MEQKHIIVAGGILVLIVIGMFTFTYLKKQEMREPANTAITTPDPESPYAEITRVDAKHFFVNGTHTLVGELLMPTPCDLLNWDTRILESSPEHAIVDFKVINHAETCAQVSTPQRFSVSFKAAENAVIRATIEGREIEVNLIPASADEKPEDFELFIKG